MPPWSTRFKQWIEEHAPLFLLSPYMRWRYRRRQGPPGEAQRVFTEIYHRNEWGDDKSRSGPGSNVDAPSTAAIRTALPELLREVGCRTFLDAPCGDFAWMSTVGLGACRYIGGDIVPELIHSDQQRYGNENRSFIHLDITKDDFPPNVDVILVRDCFIHLSFDLIIAALRNIKRNRVQYLFASTYPFKRRNWDIDTGGFRFLNLQAPPFNLPEPIRSIQEDIFPDHPPSERYLGVWRVDSLPDV